MTEIGTRTYQLDYERVFKEVLSTLVDRGFQLKTTDMARGYLSSIWIGRYRDPDERVDVRLWTTGPGVQVMIWAKTASWLARRQERSASVPVFFHYLDERIGDSAVEFDTPEGYPSYYTGPGVQLENYGFSTTLWYPISLALTNALILLFIGTGTSAYGPSTFGAFLAFCEVGIAAILLTAAALMGMGRLNGGGVVAIIGGILSFPLGLLAIVADIWALKMDKGRVPLIQDHSYLPGGLG